MPAHCASRNFLELVPVVHDFVATGPALFGIVEDGLTSVVVTGSVGVLLLFVVLETARVFAAKLGLG